jgi:hypothetical protein
MGFPDAGCCSTSVEPCYGACCCCRRVMIRMKPYWGDGVVCQRFSVLVVCFLGLVSPSLAEDWVEKQLPSYAAGIEFVAIGGDGLLYSIQSNPNGYVLTSLIDKYRFEFTGGDGFTGNILAAKEIVYLGSSCDAVAGSMSGRWVNDNTGLNVVVEGNSGQRLDFRFLDTGLEPAHSC